MADIGSGYTNESIHKESQFVSIENQRLFDTLRDTIADSHPHLISVFDSLFLDSDCNMLYRIADHYPSIKPKIRDDFIRAILRLFSDIQSLPKLLITLLRRDLKRGGKEGAGLVFRHNSLTSRCFVLCALEIASPSYVNDTLASPLKEYIAQGNVVEITQRTPTDQIPIKAESIMKQAQIFLDAIFASSVNHSLKHLFFIIQTTIADLYPSEEEEVLFAVLSGLIFLRFLCPSMVSPDQLYLIEPNLSLDPLASLTALKGLILIAKLIQNLVSGVIWTESEKEGYLVPLNPFILKNREPVKVFLRSLTDSTQELRRRYSILLQPRSSAVPETASEVAADLMSVVETLPSQDEKSKSGGGSSQVRPRTKTLPTNFGWKRGGGGGLATFKKPAPTPDMYATSRSAWSFLMSWTPFTPAIETSNESKEEKKTTRF